MLSALVAALIALPCAASGSELRGMWVSSVYNLDYPSKTGLSAAQLASEADDIIENAAAWGFNAIFLQVRPSADALYDSNIFPASVWVSGSQGTAPDGGFDPLEYFVEKAHGLDIAVHAWVNPYRITRTKADTRELAFAKLAGGHPALSMPECVVFAGDGCLYFDPGMPQTRQLVIDGVMEIVEKYRIDGIHLDDYFYPGGAFDDSASLAAYGSGISEGDFRRQSVNQLIQALYGNIKSENAYVEFGVSPFGVWANDTRHADGSATNGASSYFDMYADARAWVKGGMLDYIMPQLYWHIGSDEADFETLLSWWSDVTDGTGVKLYTGLAAYRLLEAAQGDVWDGADEIERQLNMLGTSRAEGFCMFRYGSLAQSSELCELTRTRFTGLEPPAKLLIGGDTRELSGFWPDYGISVAAGSEIRIGCRAPLGGGVTVLYAETASVLEQTPEGGYSGMVVAAETDSRREDFPFVIYENHGFVRVEIVPAALTSVKTRGEAAITEIYFGSADNWHRVEFVTGTPAAARIETAGNALRLIIAPGRMGVLFEDSFFEGIDCDSGDGAVTYSLILPLNCKLYDYRLTSQQDRIALELRQKE